MAITVTALDSGAVKDDTGSIETQATNSVSPSSNKLYLIFISSYGSTGSGDATEPIGVTGAGLTFTLLKSVIDTGISAQCLSLWGAVGTPSTGAITIDIYDGRPAYFVDWSLVEVGGVDLTSGLTSAIPTARIVSNTDVVGTNTSLSISFTVASGNGAIAGFTTTNTGTTIRTATPRTNWTEIHDVSSTYISGAAEQSLETQYRATNENTASVTWSGDGYMYGIAAELVAAAAGGTTTTKVMTDTASLTDTFNDPVRRVRLASDTVTVTDAGVFWKRFKRVMDEGLTLIDSVVKNVVLGGTVLYTKVMSEAVSLADSTVKMLRWVRGPIDTVTLSDGDTYRTSIITADEFITPSDGFVDILRLKRVASDTIDVIDGFSKALGGAGIVYAKVMSDTVTLVDDAGRRWRLRFTQLTDAVGLSDQVIDYLRAVRSIGDAVELSDGTVKVRRMVKSVDESIEVSDGNVSALYLDQMSSTSFTFGSSGPPFRFGGN